MELRPGSNLLFMHIISEVLLHYICTIRAITFAIIFKIMQITIIILVHLILSWDWAYISSDVFMYISLELNEIFFSMTTSGVIKDPSDDGWSSILFSEWLTRLGIGWLDLLWCNKAVEGGWFLNLSYSKL